MDAKQVDVMVADASHEVYVDKILDTIREAAKVRGTGIAERTHEYVTTKMKEGKAIIALCGDDFAGFTYIESCGAAVMKMNTELGYVPVTFNELTDDEAFWKGCEGCINHDILVAKNRKFCICTAMLYDPALHEEDTI